MSIKAWGQSTWIFMHTLAAKIKEEHFSAVGPNIISVIINICNHLPCPDCSQHAKEFWAKVDTSKIKTKTDLVNVLFVFHNSVNKRKQYPPFQYDHLSQYERNNLVETYNTFSKNFNTNGNMNLIAESFRRKMLLSQLRTWMMVNVSQRGHCFHS